jgi:hypothetical protein
MNELRCARWGNESVARRVASGDINRCFETLTRARLDSWQIGWDGFGGYDKRVAEGGRHVPSATEVRCGGSELATNDRKDRRADDDWHRVSSHDFALEPTASKLSDEGNRDDNEGHRAYKAVVAD